ncbi:hypothetical protein C8F01DRAFT_1261528 [Mycena amicta]|nr:hypothetical protein C8F01DRAFT_1261528 [Mycena amicta]
MSAPENASNNNSSDGMAITPPAVTTSDTQALPQVNTAGASSVNQVSTPVTTSSFQPLPELNPRGATMPLTQNSASTVTRDFQPLPELNPRGATMPLTQNSASTVTRDGAVGNAAGSMGAPQVDAAALAAAATLPTMSTRSLVRQTSAAHRAAAGSANISSATKAKGGKDKRKGKKDSEGDGPHENIQIYEELGLAPTPATESAGEARDRQNENTAVIANRLFQVDEAQHSEAHISRERDEETRLLIGQATARSTHILEVQHLDHNAPRRHHQSHERARDRGFRFADERP